MWQDGFCKVHGMAAGTSDKASVPCTTEEVWCRGKGVHGYMYTLHTGTPGAANVGNERARKCWYSPHILVVLRMADLCGQVGVRVKRTFLCFEVTAPEKATRWTYAPDSFAKA